MIYKAISVTEFIKETGKDVYCFGAGRAFDFFMCEFKNFKLEKRIRAIADNNAKEMDISNKCINGIKIPIISVEQLLRVIGVNDAILITAAAYEEIIDQLEKIKKLSTVRCYTYGMMRAAQYDYDRLNIKMPQKLSIYETIQIPKIIHYCWFGKRKMPDQYKKWMESWKRYCPDYEIIEWNEDNYDVHKNEYMSQAYEMEKWAFVSDYARIDIINEYGGVYLDTDVELIKNIDELLMNDAFCAFESNNYVAYGLGFGAKRNNLILNEIKKYYDNKNFILKDGRLDEVSCPVIQTEVMKEHGLMCNGEFQVIDGMVVYPSRVLCGMSPHTFRIERNPVYSYAIHHFAASWLEDTKGKDILIENMKKWGKSDIYTY